MSILIDKATAGDEKALETIILSVQDLVFNLSLRMLGVFPDAEDATQEIDVYKRQVLSKHINNSLIMILISVNSQYYLFYILLSIVIWYNVHIW